jgi:pimeloyl-ACP methyl ester carboxylesterase
VNSSIYKSPAGAEILEERYRDLLKLWPVTHESLVVPTGQGDTFVVASGPKEAPPLVLMHGSGGNSARWLRDVAAFAAEFRVYSVDLIGEPGLSAPSRPAYDSDAYAGWLDDVLAALDVPAAAFVGESLGGWMALDFAIRRIDRVSRLALRCPSGIGRQLWSVLPYAILQLPFGRRGRERTLRYAIGTTPPAEEAEYMLLIYEHFTPRGQLPVFSDEQLRWLTMPVNALVGGRDRMLDSATTKRRLEAAVPHAQVTLLPDAGHQLPARTDELLTFLRG